MPYGGLEDDPVTEVLGNGQRHRLGTCGEAALLRTTFGLHQLVEPARRCDVEQQVEQRDVTGFDGPHTLHGQREAQACVGVVDGAVEVGLHGLGVPLDQARMRSGVVQVDRRGQFVDDVGGCHVRVDPGRPVRPGSAEGPADAVGPQLEVIAGVVGRERGAAEAFRRRKEAGLRRTHPLPAVVDDEVGSSAVDLLGQHPTADASRTLEHQHVDARIVQRQGGGQAGIAGSDHDDGGLRRQRGVRHATNVLITGSPVKYFLWRRPWP